METAEQASQVLGPLIGQGRTADIYAWGDDRALKLYHVGWLADAVEREAQISTVVAAMGVPSPAVDGVLSVNGRLGILFERLEGPSLLHQVAARPWMLPWAIRSFTDLHLAMQAHEVTSGDLPALRERLTQQIMSSSLAPERVREVALRQLEQLPEGNALCHGDYHPDNVLVTPRGPIIVDWGSATRGHPLADVAQTELLLRVGAPPDASALRGVLVAARNHVRRAYLRRYLRRRPASAEELAAWRLPIAVARLAEEIPGERIPLMHLIKQIGVA